MTLMCSEMKLHIAILFWSSVCFTESWAALDQNVCMTNLLGQSTSGATMSSSSSAESTTAEYVFTSGWCANEQQHGDKWIDVKFAAPMGIRAVVLQAPTKQGLQTNFPTLINFLYVPVGQSQLQPYPTTEGSLSFSLSKATDISTIAFTGISTKWIRFLLNSWVGKPCFKLQILGCPAAELCPAGCSGRGQCQYEENCLCDGTSTGAQCEFNACNPVPLGLADGTITGDMITASSSASNFSEDSVASKGWCPDVGDHLPWLQVKLPKPMLVSVFVFKYITQGSMYMKTFNLKFRPATGSQQQLLDFGEEIPALNGTHYFNIRVDPPVVTDTIRIIPVTWTTSACFILDLQGCDPVSLCQQGWCLNGGSCMGTNTCLCPTGFLGSRCETTANNVPVYTFGFTRIEHNVLITTSHTFAIHGTVTIRSEGNINVLYLNGQNSFVSMNKNQTSGCIADVELCSSGFTYGLDLFLERIEGLVPILSSGADIHNGNGLSLFYTPGDGFTFIVSTTTQVWTLHVKYTLTINSWHRYEISWNKLLGVSLYVDGHLIGSATKPAPRQQPATVTKELCLGCSYTSTNTSVHMMVRDFKSWSFSRDDLVHVSAIPIEPTTSPIPTTIHVTTMHKTTQMVSASTKSTSATTQGSIKPPSTPIEGYNMTFIDMKDKVLITPTFNFTVHGTPKLELNNNGSSNLVLNGSGQSVELPDKGIPCLQDLKNCTHGFTFRLEVNFLHINTTQHTYILSSGGNVENTSGIAFYLNQGKLACAVKMNGTHWISNMAIQYNTENWYTFQISWTPLNGCTVLLDRYRLNMTMQVISTSVTFKTHPLYIGSSHNVTYTAFMKVRNLYTWTANRETLISNGMIKDDELISTQSTLSTTTRKPTEAMTTIPTTNTSPKTTSRIPISSETSMKTTVSTTPSTTELKIPEYHWNFTNIVSNHIIGSQYNLSINGIVSILDGGLHFNSTSQFIDFGTTDIHCLLSPHSCLNGVTINFSLKFHLLLENTYLFSSGAENHDGIGIAVLYRFGQLHFVLSTSTQTWFTSCPRNIVISNAFHTYMITWYEKTGLFVYINNQEMCNTATSVNHYNYTITSTHVYFGKPATSSVTTTTILSYTVQTFTIWYMRLDILVEKGICKPPIKGTTTIKPSSVVSTARTTKFTPVVTMTRPAGTTDPSGHCPVGCIPAGQPTASTEKATSLVTVPTSNTSPSSTPTTKQPTTTIRGIPPYETIPTLTPGIDNEGNAYLSCNFNNATVVGLELIVSLWINNTEVTTQTVQGSNSRTFFYIAELNEFFYNKQVKCSVEARYVGSSINTIRFYSSIFIPTIKIASGSTLVVVEGYGLEYIIVTSTAPPQFFCCKGCKAKCIVHIVGHFTGNYIPQCNKKPISDAVILSTSNTLKCGSTLTTVSWNQAIKLPIKATIDNIIDRDQRREIIVEANVYNQPQSASINVTPHVFPIGTVTVTSKDNDHRPSTCSSLNDPHMTTFDAGRYDNFNEGEFVLYRHLTLPFEVRAEYKKCSPNSRVTCNCAVAIKSGDDVITFRGCQNSQHHQNPMMTVQIYKNNELTPGTYVKRMGCGQKYEVGLPTGTVISVQNSYQSFINIWIMGSATDWRNTTGLCGIFDGNHGNDLTDSAGHAHGYGTNLLNFLISWKETNTIFYGVGESSQSVTAYYCSCVQGRESLCTHGLGMIECDRSRDDITDSLVRQAKPPVIRPRTKRQANTETPTIPNNTDEFNISDDDARRYCEDAILNNSITKDCKSLIGNNLTAPVNNCIHDYKETGNKDWARDALRDIIDQCVTRAKDIVAENLHSANSSNDTTPTPPSFNITQLLNKACLEDCGQHGHCANGVCLCDDGYSGVNCNVSSATQPTLIPFPEDGQPCDKHYVDCKAVSIAGNNFVQSENLTCHFQYTEIPYRHEKTGQKSTVAAVFMNMNNVMCPLPDALSAFIQISNNGVNVTTDKHHHVAYDSICFECHIGNSSVSDSCKRKENNCIIGSDCYSSNARNPKNECQLCKPNFNTSSWTDSREQNCISSSVTSSKTGTPSSGIDDKTLVTILAIVCAVLGVLFLISICYICKIRGKGKKTKKGNYAMNDKQLYHADNSLTKQYDNPTYVQPKLDVSPHNFPSN